jgi:hypothetical protein
MTATLLVLLAALVGGFAGGFASHLAMSRGIAGSGRSGGSGSRSGGSFPAVGDGDEIRPLRADVLRLKETVERVLQEVSDLSRLVRGEMGPARRVGAEDVPNVQRTAHGVGPKRPDPAPAAPRGPESGRDRDLAGRPGGGFPASGSRDVDLPARSTGVGAPPLQVTHDAYRDEPGAYNPAPPMASAPPNAVNVEARDDRIVSSASYPPEAWLEPKGPAVGHLWLNPGVALNENALRRLSTFFEWQGERAGLTYDTLEPAEVRWDEGQRIGTVTRRGRARPR